MQPALVFTQKGLKGAAQSTFDFFGSPTTVNESYTARVNFLELPVNVVYALGSNGEGFQLFAGPYLAVGVGGTGDYDLKISTPGQEPETYSGSQGMEFGDRFLEPTPGNGSQLYVEFRARRFDAGLNAGIGYRAGAFQMQLGYGLGLLNAQPDYPASFQQSNDTGYHRATQFTATYYFPASGGK